MALESLLKELRDRDRDTLQSQQDELDKRYQSVPLRIERIVELSGMDEETILRCCVQATWHYQDITWRDALDIVCSFFLVKKRLEEKAQGESPSSS